MRSNVDDNNEQVDAPVDKDDDKEGSNEEGNIDDDDVVNTNNAKVDDDDDYISQLKASPFKKYMFKASKKYKIYHNHLRTRMKDESFLKELLFIFLLAWSFVCCLYYCVLWRRRNFCSNSSIKKEGDVEIEESKSKEIYNVSSKTHKQY